jgi:hypothetical protein
MSKNGGKEKGTKGKSKGRMEGRDEYTTETGFCMIGRGS